jgi:hypothetical protein
MEASGFEIQERSDPGFTAQAFYSTAFLRATAFRFWDACSEELCKKWIR